MLPRNYRFVFLNRIGAALTGLTCNIRPYKYSPATIGAEVAVAGLPTTLATDAASAATAIANDVDLWNGFTMIWSATVGTSQSGFISVYMQISTDGGTTWPSINTAVAPDEVEGVFLGSIKFNAETSRSGNVYF